MESSSGLEKEEEEEEERGLMLCWEVKSEVAGVTVVVDDEVAVVQSDAIEWVADEHELMEVCC